VPEFNYRVLVVDDDPRVLALSEALLGSRGYDIRTAGDGFEALAAMRKALPDLIISDLSMPKMSGFEFLSIVRRRFPQIPVIATSGSFSGPDLPIWVLADAFIPKGGGNPQQLLERIVQLLDASPVRAYAAKPDKAPVWIPRNGDYFVLTCPDCLRSFSLPSDEFPGEAAVGEHECIHCGVTLHFVVEPLEPK
jgi:CheY-like chemotaxis protein